MLLTEIIVQLRQACPIFERRVQGTQSFVAATAENAQVDVPACFVVPLFDTAPAIDNTYSQKVTEEFATIVCLDNSVNKKDGKGMAAEVALSIARQQLNSALIGFTALAYPTMSPVQYVRGQHLLMNNSRLWHQFQWSGSYYVQANLANNDQWNKIEAILNGYFPDVDPKAIRSVLVPGQTVAPAETGNVSDYHEVLSLIQGDLLPSWIRSIPDVPSKEPGYVSEAQTLTTAPGIATPRENLQGDFTRGNVS